MLGDPYCPENVRRAKQIQREIEERQSVLNEDSEEDEGNLSEVSPTENESHALVLNRCDDTDNNKEEGTTFVAVADTGFFFFLFKNV